LADHRPHHIVVTKTAPDTRLPSIVDNAPACLVTGGSGFVGRHLVAHLKFLGKDVRSVSLSEGFDLLKEDLPLDDIGHVFHLAARTGVVEAWQNPLSFFETNAHGTARLIEQCRAKGCSVTFVSSFLDGAHTDLLATDSSLGASVNPYAFSKRVAEQYCAFYACRFGVKVVTVKMTNVYGPGQSPRFLIPHVVSQLLDDRLAEILVQDLTPCRDYLHVGDAVEGIAMSMNAPAGSVLDLGSGVAHSAEEVIQLAMGAAGIYKPYRAAGVARINEIDGTAADIDATRAILGWEPKVSLEAGLSALIESMRI
jgi:nucleoside-diphosphate-sugar epimerase